MGKWMRPQLAFFTARKTLTEWDTETLTMLMGGGHLRDVTELDFIDTNVGDVNGVSIVKLLGDGAMPKLSTLGFFQAGVGDEVAKALAQAITALPQLEVLDLAYNAIREEALSTLLGALYQEAPRLTELHLNGNTSCTDGSFLAFVALAARPCALPCINEISLFAASGRAYDALSQALSGGALPSLQKLCLEDATHNDDLPAELLCVCAEREIQLDYPARYIVPLLPSME
uniref:Uncharacterized protein n=1 Tax=Calcidiscus leptoporus TaxID=127549 RepID=A0A7S0IPJ8_9EUKA